MGASAQETQTTEGEQTAQEDAEKIIVVGSRIRADGFERAVPVEVISASMASGQGIGDIGELLRSSTVAAGSPQVTAASSTAFVQAGGTGAQTLSLRGLGANRTLVLLNGRRAGPAGTRGETSAFDFNVLPLSVIDRVEILKDGASSLYGSDAVAGVVNIITKKGDGGNIEGSYTQPQTSGGEQFRINATYGQSFDRGSFRVTADYKLDKELAKGDRSYFDCGELYIFDPDTGERRDNIDPRSGNYHCEDLLWGHVWIYDYQDDGNVPSGAKAQYDYGGNLGQYIPGFATDPNNPDYMGTPAGWYPVNYDRASDSVTDADHPFQDLESHIPKTELATFFAQADYQLTDDISLYSEALLSRRTNKVNGYRQYWGYIYNSNFDFENGVAEGAGNPLSAGWTGAQWLSPTPITDHSGSKIEVDYQRFVLGLTGDLGEWYWDMSYQYSRSEGKYTSKIIFDDAISDQNFLRGSCEGDVTSVRGVPCVDIPWLDPELLRGNISQQVRDFMFGQETGKTIYKQSTIEGFISGDLMDIWAGPVGAAFGASYQKDEIEDVPGEHTLADNVWGASTAGITAGDDNSTAVFGELQIPLLRDVTMANFLDLSLSARYTDVDSYGSDTTYKIGLNWELFDGFRVRASRGTSFRSPALFELYLANQKSFANQRNVDPCIRWEANLANNSISETIAQNCAADGIPGDYAGGAISADVLTGGGAGVLEAETSVAKTIGFVWQPGFADISLSVDYFDFLIEDEVTKLGASTIVRQCYDSDTFATEPLCRQFQRSDVDNRIEEIRDSYLNVATQTNKGVDISLKYRTETQYGMLVLSTDHTFQTESEQQLFADSKIEDTNGEFGDPKHVATFNMALDQDEWSFNWNVRYVGKVSNYLSYGNDEEERFDASYRGETVRVILHDDGTFYHAFSASKTFGDSGLSATFGVANAFNKKPPRVSTLDVGELDYSGNSAFYSQYDWLGRRFFLTMSYDF
ncbi:TonB-dependent receptor [Bowmanella sp. Y26]|uniref:TonB-dependent receptor plug domain-containing protein n=1 Tax=Bowmanella yangjiangensis TaxID=2811230 RepID=UPI001BDD79B2|nr:TonB-dependent receptor [Bowmanella yangjiangensis]MBT1061977.1 TonB-dependent receptor [Bowmanella yangjiangensis]